MALVLKNLPGNARDVSSIPGSGRSLGAGNGKSSPVFLPGKFNGQRSLVGYHPWGCKESDTNGHTYIYTQTHQNLCTQISSCPLHNRSSRRLNSYLDTVVISQTQKRLYNTPVWNWLQQILLKTLPRNIFLSFEGEFNIWKLSKDLA